MLSSSSGVCLFASRACRRGGSACRLSSNLRHLAPLARQFHTGRPFRCARTPTEIGEGDWYFYDGGKDGSEMRREKRKGGMGPLHRSSSNGASTGARSHTGNALAANDNSSYTEGEEGEDERRPTLEDVEMQRRRRLYEAAAALKAVVDGEITAEVERDAEDGAAAVPPFAPGGWTVKHPAGSSYFTMTRTIPGYTRVASDEKEKLYLRLGGRGAMAAAGEDDVDSTVGEMRFRSLRDDPRRRLQRSLLLSRQASQGSPSLEDELPTFPLSQQQRQRQPVRHASREHGERSDTLDQRVAVPRSDIHVTLFAPFRVQDLSFHDPTNNICEYAVFDVLVRKTPPAALDAYTQAGRRVHLLRGQRETWESGSCLFLRLASANSELRLRSVQVLTNAAARRVEEGGCFGHGDPFFGELLARETPVLRRQERLRRLRERQRERGSSRSGDRVLLPAEDELSSPTRRFLKSRGRGGGGDDDKAEANEAAVAVSGMSPAEALLKTDFSLAGNVGRAQLYPGPYLTELSKELKDALLSYVMTDLGISNEVREYVCQMQYFMEQEEYMAWLARCRYLADRLQNRTPHV